MADVTDVTDDQVDAIAVQAIEALDQAVTDVLNELDLDTDAVDALSTRVYDAIRSNLDPGF